LLLPCWRDEDWKQHCHMWTPPFGKDFYERLCKRVGCSHMSGLCARLLWPLALMISAD
jgi:hypothetical protein